MTRKTTYLHSNPLLMLLLCTLLLPFFVSAEPYLAQRYGLKCSGCHSNITGGGKRNDAGNAYAMGLTETLISTSLTPKLGESFSIGANFRADWTYSQFDDPQPDDAGNSGAAIEDISEFNVSSGTLYMEFAMSKELSFYIDQQVAPEGGRTREAMAIYRGFGGEDSYLKVGKFFLPYGLRLQDDKAFIRQNTGFNFDNSDLGLEYGYEAGPWSFVAALSNGTQGAGENNSDKQVSTILSYIQPGYRFGVSATKNNAPNGFAVQGVNLFGGFTYDKWVLLWQLDRLEHSSTSSQTNQLITFVSANYLFSPSLNLKLSYEYFDPNDDIDEDEQIRASFIAEKFLNQFLQLRAGVRIYDGIPQSPIQNQDLLFTEFHLFF